VNMISPTSGILLAYLASAQVPYGVWIRYVLPLFCLLTALALVVVAFAIAAG